MLCKTIDDIREEYGYSDYCCAIMKDEIEEQLVKVLETYQDLEELEPILELPDYAGRDCFWYFQQYTLYHVLDVKIMDKFVQERWEGCSDVNCSMLEYSLSYQILTD